MNTAIVLAYGIFQPENEQYKSYIDKAFEEISLLQSEKIIICGGITSRLFPTTSEAKSILDYVQEIYPEMKDRIDLEERSLTTLQNIEFARSLVTDVTSQKITFFCDSIRSSKVFYLSLKFFSEPVLSDEEIYQRLLTIMTTKKTHVLEDTILVYKNIEVKGINLEREITEVGDQITASMLEVAFSQYPSLHEEFIEWRKKEWGLK